MEISCQEISLLIGGELIGDGSLKVDNLRGIERAEPGDLSFLYDSRYEKFLSSTNATCVITYKEIKDKPKENQCFITLDDPHAGFVKIIKFVDTQMSKRESFVHKSAVFGENCDIDDSVYIGANCVIGKNVKIAEGVSIKPNVVIYDNVKIGKNTVLHSNSTLYQNSEIGENCIIHAGAVIGSDGFGYLENKETGELDKIPHIGKVIIEDDVEIGANTTIDRAMIGKTIIGKGSKLDNLVQIGHNTEIGENSAFAAQAGISGSVKIGRRNRFGGQTGAAGHITTTDDVVIMAQSGIAKSVEEKGLYFGSPIKDKRTAFKIEAGLKMLPDLIQDIKQIKRKLS